MSGYSFRTSGSTATFILSYPVRRRFRPCRQKLGTITLSFRQIGTPANIWFDQVQRRRRRVEPIASLAALASPATSVAEKRLACLWFDNGALKR